MISHERKVAVVTGSSSGIGAAAARLFARNGFDVVINFARDAAPAEDVAQECRQLGSSVLVVQADVSDDAACRRLGTVVAEKWGHVDALVNNAGRTKFASASDLDALNAQDFHDIYAVNVVGAYQMIRALVPLLRVRPGAGIVNVSSIAAVMGAGSSIAYAASKGALNALTYSMARALAPHIRVNAVAPGMVETPWLQKGLGEAVYSARREEWIRQTPLAAVITPDDVADACYWLCVGATKTTGEVIPIDSGRTRFVSAVD